MVTTILFIIAAVLFAIASFGARTPIHLGWAGAFFLALAFAIGGGGLE
jgi:hypothetical protein